MNSELIIYQNPDGNIKIDVRLEEETVWLTQDQMATLFGKAKSTINEHIKNVFSEGELDEKVVIRKFRITTFSSSSPSENTFLICSLMVDFALPNKVAIWSWVSQTVSSSSRTSILMLPSGFWYMMSSLFILLYLMALHGISLNNLIHYKRIFRIQIK